MRSRAAFTLTELIVVIGVVVLLAALLFPSFGKMRAQAGAATCLGNLRNIGGLIGTYVADRDGMFPSSTDYNPEDPVMTGAPNRYTWDEKLVIEGIMSKDDLRLTRSGCPTNRNKMTKGCYGYNYEQLGNENRPQGSRLVRNTSLEQASKTVMVMDNFGYGDGKGWSLLAWWFGTDPSDEKAPGAPVGHGGMVNVLWADGHVSPSTLKGLYTHDPEFGVNPDRPTPWYFSVKK